MPTIMAGKKEIVKKMSGWWAVLPWTASVLHAARGYADLPLVLSHGGGVVFEGTEVECWHPPLVEDVVPVRCFGPHP
jgi:hypothetical protein